MRHKITLDVHICLTHDDQIFLLRRFQTGYEDGAYTVIAGHVDANESAKVAAVREAAEEVGVLIREEDLDFLGCMHRCFADGVAVNLFFIARCWDGIPKNAEPNKCDHAGWFSLSDLPENIVSYVRPALERIGSGTWHLEYGWEKD